MVSVSDLSPGDPATLGCAGPGHSFSGLCRAWTQLLWAVQGLDTASLTQPLWAVQGLDTASLTLPLCQCPRAGCSLFTHSAVWVISALLHACLF